MEMFLCWRLTLFVFERKWQCYIKHNYYTTTINFNLKYNFKTTQTDKQIIYRNIISYWARYNRAGREFNKVRKTKECPEE